MAARAGHIVTFGMRPTAPEAGYGSTPKPSIPANSTLIFDVELLGIE